MQINLKQNEIVAALKQYIAQKGIHLQDKDVSITFTAGRKESGISAEMVIEETDIPGFSDGTVAEEPTKPVGLSVVVKPIPVEPMVSSVPESPASEEVTVPVKPSSLFNN